MPPTQPASGSSNAVCVDDPVYGETCFTEDLLVDLHASQAVQRLRSIYQGGITAFIKPERQTTRLDHSLGVAALLRRLGAGVEEQAAGLVHDVAHTAFSHVIDFVYPNREHDYHETHRDEMILQSDLPQVLARHGYDWRWITEAENFSLLEQPLPNLCADRLDYFLRDGVVDVGTFTRGDAVRLLEHLAAHDGRIVVDDFEAARWLGERFMELDDVCWCSVQEVGWYAVMAQALRVALSRKIIGEEAFAGTDAELLSRLRRAQDPAVKQWLELLDQEVDFEVIPDQDSEDFDLVALPKVRAVDPPVLHNKQVIPLSGLDPGFAERRSTYLRSKQGVWKLRIVRA
jgi:HD superfamily phosphohydrolase